MKIVRKLDKPVDVTEDCFCNKCGGSTKSPMGCYYGLVEATVTGGYESNHLEDGDVHKFSLCEACLVELFAEFKYPSLQGNYLFEETPRQADFHPEDHFLNDKPVPPMSPEDAAALKEALDQDASFAQINSPIYDPFDNIIEELSDSEMAELMDGSMSIKKKEDLN